MIKVKQKNLSKEAELLIENLADLEHRQWQHWTKYFLRYHHCKNFRKRWKKQIKIPYSKLSEKEKESDRVWARKVIVRKLWKINNG